MRSAGHDEYLDMDDSDLDDFEAVLDRNAAVLTCARVHCGGQFDVIVSREHAKSLLWCPESRHNQTLRWERCYCQRLKMRWRWTLMLEWSQRWCEEVQRESVPYKEIKPTWKYVLTLLVSAATVTQLKH